MAGNFCAHSVQEVSEILDFRLAGGVFDYSPAFSANSAHHEILGSRMRREIKAHGCPLEFDGCRAQKLVLFLNNRPEFLEAFQVKIHRARTYGASAGHGDMELPESSEQGAGKQEGCPHLFDQFVRSYCFIHICRVNFQHSRFRIV
ncbi:hypothetical protein ES708_33125 [subsurface metagenome]